MPTQPSLLFHHFAFVPGSHTPQDSRTPFRFIMNVDDWQLGFCFLENKNPAVAVKFTGASTHRSKRALISGFCPCGMHSSPAQRYGMCCAGCRPGREQHRSGSLRAAAGSSEGGFLPFRQMDLGEGEKGEEAEIPSPFRISEG